MGKEWWGSTVCTLGILGNMLAIKTLHKSRGRQHASVGVVSQNTSPNSPMLSAGIAPIQILIQLLIQVAQQFE